MRANYPFLFTSFIWKIKVDKMKLHIRTLVWFWGP